MINQIGINIPFIVKVKMKASKRTKIEKRSIKKSTSRREKTERRIKKNLKKLIHLKVKRIIKKEKMKDQETKVLVVVKVMIKRSKKV